LGYGDESKVVIAPIASTLETTTEGCCLLFGLDEGREEEEEEGGAL
jgi:hypothetical protein